LSFVFASTLLPGRSSPQRLVQVRFLANMATSSAAAPTTSGSGHSSPYQNDATQIYLDSLNKSLPHNYLWSLLALIGLLFAYSAVTRFNAHLRHLTSISGAGSLHYFAASNRIVALAKNHLLYAPLLFYRRARELKLTEHVTLGSIPTRFQALFILLVTVTNVFACTWNVPWSDPQLQVLPILRNRTGTLSVANLIPIMVMSSIKNPLISALNISYDSFNLSHRWFGRLSILQGIAHVLCWLIAKVQSKGWAAVGASMQAPFIYTGLIAAVGLVVILFAGPKLFRNLAYEFFLHLHVAMVLTILVGLWVHLKGLSQQGLLLGAIIIWAVSRSLRLGTLLYRSVGNGGSKAKIEPLNSGAVKVTITVVRPWTHRPGQSLYLTIPAIGLWTAHPFSVAWAGAEDCLGNSISRKSSFNEKAPIVHVHQSDVEKDTAERTVSLIIKKHDGFTNKLWERAMTSNSAATGMTALVEGPYGTERSLASYGTVLLFASGVGITHQLGYVKQLVEGFDQATVAARRVTLVWVVPSTECLDWIRPWMHEILGMECRREVLKVMLYITRAGLSQSIKSPSEQVQMFRGRPDVDTIIRREAMHKIGCMGVSVCAGGGLADEVRRVSRSMLERGVNLDFMEEGFGW
jgi:predicted ferric reductase